MYTKPKSYYNDADNCQTILFPYGTVIPIIYDGVLPYIPVRIPTPYEIDSCPCIDLVERHECE